MKTYSGGKIEVVKKNRSQLLLLRFSHLLRFHALVVLSLVAAPCLVLLRTSRDAIGHVDIPTYEHCLFLKREVNVRGVGCQHAQCPRVACTFFDICLCCLCSWLGNLNPCCSLSSLVLLYLPLIETTLILNESRVYQWQGQQGGQ